MAWWLTGLILFGSNLGLAILSSLLNSRSAPESAPGEPQFPVADPQKPVPVFYGKVRVGMNVTYKAGVTLGENTVRNGALSFGWSSTKISNFYYLDLEAVIGHGPIDLLWDVYVDGTRSLANAPTVRTATLGLTGVTYTTANALVDTAGLSGQLGAPPRVFTITAGDLLGGKLSRGGIGAGGDAGSTGTLRIYSGHGRVDHNTRLETLHGAALPTYPTLVRAVFENNFYFGNSESLPGVEFVVSRTVAPWGGTGYVGNVTAISGNDAIPAGVLWDLLTNTTYGLGIPEEELDSSSFSYLSTATSFLDMGVGFVLTEQTPAKSVIADLLRTLDGTLYTDPETGLLCVRLLQAPTASYYGSSTVSSGVTLDASNITDITWSESAPDATVNEIKVEFTDKDRDWTKNTVTVRNVAAIQALGRVESRTVSFLGCQTKAQATRYGMRELRARSAVLGHATITTDRRGYTLTPAGTFTLAYDIAGQSSRTMRVVSVRDTPAGQVIVEAVEDIYSQPASSFAVEDTPEPVPPATYPFVAPYGYIEPSLTGTTTGNTTLFLYDPRATVTLVEYRTRSGAAAYSSWTTKAFPYQASVTLDDVADSAIDWRVTYTDGAGASQQLTYTYTFGVDTAAAQATADAVIAAGTTLGSIGIPTVFVNTTEASQWLALSTIPAAATEIGTEFRRRRYLVGAGSVRIHANVKALTNTPTIGLYYATDAAFTSPVSLGTLSVSGTGQQTSAWFSLPTGAKADVYLTPYVADGADTAAVDLYALAVEFLPTTVSGVREHSAEHAPEFS